MAKSHITITLDNEISELAKIKGINLSGTINSLLKDFLKPKTSDLQEENIKVVCGICSKEIIEGYMCEFSKVLLCNKCQDEFNMKRCPHGADRKHEHTKWTRETLNKLK